jgi:5S rRNA maturation endonuclease (ribonuclease M5)
MVTIMDLKSKKNKSNLIDQSTLKIVCDQVCDRIEDLLQYLHLEYRINSKFVSMKCPIHGGDNDSAVNVYYTGDLYRGNWKCRTHQCEKFFKGSILGFIRGVLSHQKYDWSCIEDKNVSFAETLEFTQKFLDLDLNKIKINKADREKIQFVSNLSVLQQNNKRNNTGVKRHQIRKSLVIPSPYFVQRGFDPKVLDRYDVGDCVKNGKEMFNRAVVPIYDVDNQYMIGCTGRTILEDIKPKWRHNSGFKAEENLYNFWYAKDIIQKTKVAILVESPGNVWKLEENNIKNSVALFGSNLNDKQKMLLDTSGAMKLIVIMDSDNAGEKARSQIDRKCSKIYNIEHIRVSKNDIAELTNQEIKEQILAKAHL